MDLPDYHKAIEQIEAGDYPSVFESQAAAAGFLRREIAGRLWQPWVRGEVDDLLDRLAAIERAARPS